MLDNRSSHEEFMISATSASVHDNASVSEVSLLAVFAIFFHAVVIEAWFCIAECVIRSIIFLILFSGAVILAWHPKYRRFIFPLLIESLKCFCAAFSFMVPGLICQVYWGSLTQSNWNLLPISTIIGKIDCRRFLIICIGNGSLAENIDDLSEKDSNCLNQDTFPSSPILYPSEISTLIQSIFSKMG